MMRESLVAGLFLVLTLGGTAAAEQRGTWKVPLLPPDADYGHVRVTLSVGGGSAVAVVFDTGSMVAMMPAGAIGSASRPMTGDEVAAYDLPVDEPGGTRHTGCYGGPHGQCHGGQYVLASITLGVAGDFAGGTVPGHLATSAPMPVVAVDTFCHAGKTGCRPDPDFTGILGIGLDQGRTWRSNIIYHLDTQNPGYIIAYGAPEPYAILGLPPEGSSERDGFAMISLRRKGNGDASLESFRGCVTLARADGTVVLSTVDRMMFDTGTRGASWSTAEDLSALGVADSTHVHHGNVLSYEAPCGDGVRPAVSMRYTVAPGNAQGEESRRILRLRPERGSLDRFIAGTHLFEAADFLFDAGNPRDPSSPAAVGFRMRR